MKVPVKSEQFVGADFGHIAKTMLSSVKQYTLLVPQLEKDTWLKPSQLVKLGEEAVLQRQERDLKKKNKSSHNVVAPT